MKKVPRRDRTALPKLQMNPGSSATEMIQVLQQWMSQMGLVLATWTDTATEWWQRIISEARADHVQFCRLGARERALLHGQSRETFALPTAVSPLEGQVRADLIRGDLLPKAVKNALHLQGIDTVLGILKIIFREYMPSESTCRLETLQALEPSSQSRSNLQGVSDSPSALQLRLASIGPGVKSNPGLPEDVSKSSRFADKRAQRRPPFCF